MKQKIFLKGLAVTGLFFIIVTGCQKNTPDTSQLYIPSQTDVTANATLKELQDGRALYIDHCGACHTYYLPESFTPSQWRSILPTMTPRTNLTSAQIQLVTKYLTKGH
jgi:mono/diheme cytochrome c family protein